MKKELQIFTKIFSEKWSICYQLMLEKDIPNFSESTIVKIAKSNGDASADYTIISFIFMWLGFLLRIIQRKTFILINKVENREDAIADFIFTISSIVIFCECYKFFTAICDRHQSLQPTTYLNVLYAVKKAQPHLLFLLYNAKFINNNVNTKEIYLFSKLCLDSIIKNVSSLDILLSEIDTTSTKVNEIIREIKENVESKLTRIDARINRKKNRSKINIVITENKSIRNNYLTIQKAINEYHDQFKLRIKSYKTMILFLFSLPKSSNNILDYTEKFFNAYIKVKHPYKRLYIDTKQIINIFIELFNNEVTYIINKKEILNWPDTPNKVKCFISINIYNIDIYDLIKKLSSCTTQQLRFAIDGFLKKCLNNHPPALQIKSNYLIWATPSSFSHKPQIQTSQVISTNDDFTQDLRCPLFKNIVYSSKSNV